MKELTISKFNELSNAFLNTTVKDCRENMINFKNFIDNDENVKSILADTIEGVEFNYRFCFYWRVDRCTVSFIL